jgi:heme-degrading monooxygenase HmoA
MILEVAVLDIGNGTCEEFEAAFHQASPLISCIPGYISHELRRCLEKSNRYILLVNWQTSRSSYDWLQTIVRISTVARIAASFLSSVSDSGTL